MKIFTGTATTNIVKAKLKKLWIEKTTGTYISHQDVYVDMNSCIYTFGKFRFKAYTKTHFKYKELLYNGSSKKLPKYFELEQIVLEKKYLGALKKLCRNILFNKIPLINV